MNLSELHRNKLIYITKIKARSIKGNNMRKNFTTERSRQKRYLTLQKSKRVQPPVQQFFKYYLGPGNNSSLIRRILSTRKQWQQVCDPKHILLNFKWQQTSKTYKYQNCVDNNIFKDCLNHFQFHHQLSNKEHLFKNLQEYCQSRKIDVFDFVPLTFTLNLSESTFQQNQADFLRVYQRFLPGQLKKPGQKQVLHIKKKRISGYRNMEVKQKNISKFPIKTIFMQQDSKFLWILKPTFQNRGNGIHVFNKLESLQGLMNSYLNGDVQASRTSFHNQSSPQTKGKNFRIRQLTTQHNKSVVTSFIIQKYLQRPLLIQGRKFDIRMWVLVTHQMKVFLFKQGYIRTSSHKYSTDQISIFDLNVHLTNNAVQKNSQQYGKFQDGNQLSFKYLKNLVEDEGHNYHDLINKIKLIIKMTMLSVKKKLNKGERANCFQIFGYDFMLDQNCKPWLIEVNTNPCIQESSVLLQNLLPRMLDDAFCLTLDKIFQTEKKGYNYSLQNQYSTDNLWQIIVDLKKVGQIVSSQFLTSQTSPSQLS